MMVDTSALRTKMVDGQIRPSDVTDHRIIAAMLEIPREAFLPDGSPDLAYLDLNLDVTGGARARYLIQPMALARLVQAAEIEEGDRVLEIGTATGYGAAVLSRLAAKVIALEEDRRLIEKASNVLKNQEISNVEVVSGPLDQGYAAAAPYDVIVFNGAIEILPAAITQQLKEGGRLVAVVGVGLAGKAMLYKRSGEEASGRVIFNASLPLLPGFARVPAFQF